jgi:hypothetical protein
MEGLNLSAKIFVNVIFYNVSFQKVSITKYF